VLTALCVFLSWPSLEPNQPLVIQAAQIFQEDGNKYVSFVVSNRSSIAQEFSVGAEAPVNGIWGGRHRFFGAKTISAHSVIPCQSDIPTAAHSCRVALFIGSTEEPFDAHWTKWHIRRFELRTWFIAHRMAFIGNLFAKGLWEERISFSPVVTEGPP
jgi:hypothetical protein